MPSSDRESSTPPPLPRPAGPGYARALARPFIFGLAAVLWLATFLFTMDRLPLPTCAFLRWTGRPCPGCGAVHALVEISHGHWASAWALNPFAYAIWPPLALFGLGFLVPPFGRSLRERLVRHDRPLSIVFAAFLLALIAFGAVRFALAR